MLFKMGNCEDPHNSNCMLDNAVELLSCMFPPFSTWKCSTIYMLEDNLPKNLSERPSHGSVL